MARSSSSSVKSSPPSFSVRYRFPYATPRSRIGTPRNDRMGGWFGGKPTDRGSSAMSCRRSGTVSLINTPRIPRPRGRSPIAACVSASTPVVRKRSSALPLWSITPRAAYLAPVRSAAASTIRCSTASSESSELSAMPASTRRRSRLSTVDTRSLSRRERAGASDTPAAVVASADVIHDLVQRPDTCERCEANDAIPGQLQHQGGPPAEPLAATTPDAQRHDVADREVASDPSRAVYAVEDERPGAQLELPCMRGTFLLAPQDGVTHVRIVGQPARSRHPRPPPLGCGKPAARFRSAADVTQVGDAHSALRGDRGTERSRIMKSKHLLLATAAGTAVAAALAVSASGAANVSLQIRHQVRGCHTWSVNGGAYKASQTVTVTRGTVLTVVDNDV